MKSLSLIFLSLIICMSCFKENESVNDDPEVSGNIGFTTSFTAPKIIEGVEAEYGREICEALAIKRVDIVSSTGNPIRRVFNINQKNCAGSTIPRNNVEGFFDYDNNDRFTIVPISSRSGRFPLNDVITDQSKRLRTICQQLRDGGFPSDSEDDFGLKYKVNFYKERGSYKMRIARYTNRGGRFLPNSIEISTVITQSTARNGANIGYISLRRDNLYCANGRSDSFISQTLR